MDTRRTVVSTGTRTGTGIAMAWRGGMRVPRMLSRPLPRVTPIVLRLLAMMGAVVLVVAAGSGCSTLRPDASALMPVSADEAFGAPVPVPTADDIFRASPAMLAYLRGELAAALRHKGKIRGLAEAVVGQGSLRLEYDAAHTRTAAEAFEARAGDCLSLVIMTAALARELGLQVRFQDMRTQVWERRDEQGLDLGIGHVNILIGHGPGDGSVRMPYSQAMLVDFLPQTGAVGVQGHAIDERRVVAMLLNNRASEALLEADLRAAYWHARAALRSDPGFAQAWNTLGVVLERAELFAKARLALTTALQLDSDYESALSNLVRVAERLDRPDEAREWAQALQRLRPQHPLALYEAGRQAMARRDWQAARPLLQRALERGGDWHALHFALAQVFAQLGQGRQAEAHLALARDSGTTPALRERYEGKLGRLRQSLATPAPNGL